MGRFIRTVVIAYAALVGVCAAWAWYVDVLLLHSSREHLLPDILLALVSLPASRSLGPLFDTWPGVFSRPLAQLAWLTFCGFSQAAALWLVCKQAARRVARGA